MDKKDNSKEVKSKQAIPREKLYLGVICALVVLCGVLTWMVFENRSTVENISLYNENLQEDKKALNDELGEILSQYDELETDNQELQGEILDQKSRIEELQEEIEKSKGNLTLIRRYKKEVTTLRTIMKGYVVTIDSLNTMNQNLITENTNIKQELSSTQAKNSQLSNAKKDLEGIVKKASILQTTNLSFEGIRLRNSGKQVETSRSNRVELFKVCCTLLENLTTNSGYKVVYLQIFDPQGNLLVEDSAPNDPDAPAKFSSKREIEYSNKEMDICVYTNLNGMEISEGTYTVKLFEAGAEIGNLVSSFK